MQPILNWKAGLPHWTDAIGAVESRPPLHAVPDPGFIQCTTEPIQPVQLRIGGVTSLQPLPEEGDLGAHPQLQFEGPGRGGLPLAP